MTRIMSGLAVFLGLASACGGHAVADDPLAAGGAGGGMQTATTGTSASGTAVAGTGVTGTAVTATSVTSGSGVPNGSGFPGACGPKPMNCAEACVSLFCCALEGDNCPNVEPIDEPGFIRGCTDACDDQLVGLVDPFDCKVTVDTLAVFNAEFKQACFGG